MTALGFLLVVRRLCGFWLLIYALRPQHLKGLALSLVLAFFPPPFNRLSRLSLCISSLSYTALSTPRPRLFMCVSPDPQTIKLYPCKAASPGGS